MHGPQTEFSDDLHAQKYRRPGESFREAMNRIAGALSDGEAHFRNFRSALLNQRFLPGGRIQAAIGSGRHVTAYNCFVSGEIADALSGGEATIMGRATQACETMRRGGGIGYDFSTIRPRGSLIQKLESTATGPVSFMEIFDGVGRTISSSGHRRGAQMGVLRVDHPDIEEFIRAKRKPGALAGFNLSIAVTDKFMKAVEDDLPFDLVFDRKVCGQVQARALWDQIMRSTWDWAEPGVLFIDQINRENNLHYCETIAATNPCGEQPLPPFGACLLGSVNLVKYIRRATDDMPASFDMDQLAMDIPPIVRAMDNVIDRTQYPLREQEDEARNKRRMGLGITGLANALAFLGLEYGSPAFLQKQDYIQFTMKTLAYAASVDLAIEKGAFPLFDKDEYLDGKFVSRLPDFIRGRIGKYGIRNSHLLSIAPTGTISMAADNISSGIEPVFRETQKRLVSIGGGDPVEVVLEDYGYAQGLRDQKTADQCSPEDHLSVLALATKHVDSAVSKTCNVPSTMHWDDFKRFYMSAWHLGCKGITTFTTGGQRDGIISDGADEPASVADTAAPKLIPIREPEQAAALPVADLESCTVDAVTGRRDCA